MSVFRSLCEEKVGSESKCEADEVHNTMRMTQSMFDPLEMSETVAPQARNPRDRSILDAIWQGMLVSIRKFDTVIVIADLSRISF